METVVGIKGKDFVMLAADSSHPQNIVVLKDGKYRTNLAFLTNIRGMIRQKRNKKIFHRNSAFRCQQDLQTLGLVADCCCR